MTELEDLKNQERECKLQMSNLVYYSWMCREKLIEWHEKYKKVKDKLAILEVERMVNQT